MQPHSIAEIDTKRVSHVTRKSRNQPSCALRQSFCLHCDCAIKREIASSMPFYNVELTEHDVPGAKLIHAEVGANSCEALRRWLECRGLPTSGKKETLEQRYVRVFCCSLLHVAINELKMYLNISDI